MEDEILINNHEIQKKNLEFKVLLSSVKIEIDQNHFGSGFFLKLKKNNGKEFYCVMTNQHVITPEMIEQKITISILYENENSALIIKLDQEDRFIKYYLDSLKIDATVIQILDKDDISKKDFLEPYDDYKKGFQQFIGKTIWVAQYPLGKQLSMSTGKIKNNNNIIIVHTASTLEGSSGGPIVLEGSDKVLGIHRGGDGNVQENYGNFIGPVIDDIKKFERNGFGNDFYKNGEMKYIGNFKNDKYDDDNGLFYYEEGYNDGIFYYEKGDFFNGKFKEGKKIEGKIYDKNSQLKFEGSFQNDIPIINISDNDFNLNNDNNYIYDDDNENNKVEDRKENSNDENDLDQYENGYIDSFEECDNDRGVTDIRLNNIESAGYINNNISNNNNNSVNNKNNNGNGIIIGTIKKIVYNGFDPIKNYLPPFKCNACGHKIQSHKKIGDAKWTCSECSNNRICLVK